MLIKQEYQLSVNMYKNNSIESNTIDIDVEATMLSKDATKIKRKIPKRTQHCLHPLYCNEEKQSHFYKMDMMLT